MLCKRMKRCGKSAVEILTNHGVTAAFRSLHSSSGKVSINAVKVYCDISILAY
jgi:hypothetical protein